MDSIFNHSNIALPDTTHAGQSDLSALLQQAVDSVTAVLKPLDSHLGVAGEPLPYTIHNDDLMNIVLIGSMLLFIIAVARSMPFIIKQTKNFFRPINDDSEQELTSGELRLQICLALLDCMLLGTSIYMYAYHQIDLIFVSGSHAPIIALFTGAFMAYFVLKMLIYTCVNLTLFGGKQNVRLLKSLLFIMALQAMLLSPIVLLQVYLGLSQNYVTNLSIFIVILAKLLTFYKAWSIFFRKNGTFLQTFLYFCTLEITPLLAMGGVLVQLANAIKVNY